MPVQRANYDYQASLFELEEYELDDEQGKPVTPQEAQMRSEQARRALEKRIVERPATRKNIDETQPVGDWFDDYASLVEGQWPWRVAAYIAWAASPRVGRWPATQDALAREVLGLTSDRQIAKWRRKNPAIMDLISDLQTAPMLKHRADVIGALVESATTADYKNHQDRKLFLEITGDYVPTSKLLAHLKRSMPDGADGMSDEDLIKYAGYEETPPTPKKDAE